MKCPKGPLRKHGKPDSRNKNFGNKKTHSFHHQTIQNTRGFLMFPVDVPSPCASGHNAADAQERNPGADGAAGCLSKCTELPAVHPCTYL